MTSLCVISILCITGIFPNVFAETLSVTIPEATSIRGCERSNECYIPYEVTINVGDEVIWTNIDMAFHTVTSGNSMDGPNGIFDSGMFKIDEQFSYKFEDSGSFDYFCTLHPWMEGIVIVKEEKIKDDSQSEKKLEDKATDAGDAIVDAGKETGELIIEAGKEAGEIIVDVGEDVYQKGVELEEEHKEERQEIADKVEQTGSEVLSEIEERTGGGCLIATATYGSELAPQVQQLRELRDNKLLQTQSGSAFIHGFNDIYYSFSPTIADYERNNPIFKETIKLAITPMISSLSILNFVDMNSEMEVLGYGLSIIFLNIGMYVGLPAVVIVGIKKKF